jgi:hypothetical protein
MVSVSNHLNVLNEFPFRDLELLNVELGTGARLKPSKALERLEHWNL